ncbi:MAG: LysM peptidoglycan-binding domain-containing protein [Burkholderiales bacterium]
MLGKRYDVVAGDNLWNIAKVHLGSGAQWPRIWRYNNRRDVVRATGRGIQNPDLIYVGQVLLIPTLPGTPIASSSPVPPPPGLVDAQPPSVGVPPPVPSPQPVRHQGPLLQQLPNVESPISFKYRLDDFRAPPIETPAARIEFRMTGDVVMMSRKAYPALYVTSRQEIEAQVTSEMNHAFGKLVQDNRFIFNPADGTVTVRSMLVSQSKTPNTISTAIGVEASSGGPFPKLRAEIRFPKLEGTVDRFVYVAMDVKFVIEITPKLQPPAGPSPQPLRYAPPVRVPQYQTDWGRVIGTGLVATAAVIVVATIVEDVLTAGVGVADDPASFAAASAALLRGLAMIRGAALPAAMAPASLTLGAAVQIAH